MVDRRCFFAAGNTGGDVMINDTAAAVVSLVEPVVTSLPIKALGDADHVASSSKQNAALDPRNHRLPVSTKKVKDHGCRR